MGFFSRKTTVGKLAARRDRPQHAEDQRRRGQHTATVIPPSEAYNPQPVPASVYQANGVPAAPAATAAAAPYDAAAFPSNDAPVQATMYVPGQGAPPAAVSAAAPVVATAYVPGASPPATTVHAAVPVQAAAAPPATNPYGMLQSQQTASFNNGNANYNTDESAFWECVVCTFPNMRTEPNCKGCGSPIPPGLLQSAATAAVAQQQVAPSRPPQDTTYGNLNAQMNGMSLGGEKLGGAAGAGAAGGAARGGAAGGVAGLMRVHIPNGMGPGQKIMVRSPDGEKVVKTIPPSSEWHYDDDARPFFRIQFEAPTVAHEVQSPHTIAWREFFSAPGAGHYSPPPLAMRAVPSTPVGSGSPVPPNGRHKCLVVGINYVGSHAQLRGCINDAKNMQGLLRRNSFPDDGAHMLLLTDERNRGREYQPTVENITRAFNWLMKDVRKGDVLFFHFSGHGSQQPDKAGMEVDGYNETIVPVDYERKGQISDDVLWGSLVYRLPAGARITALMDMCHSGTGLDLPYDYNVDTRRWSEDVNPAHSAGDVVLFSGCEDAQTSADVGGGYGKQAGGAMTQAFMGAYDTCNGRAATYHDFLVAVKKQLRKKKFTQRPQLTSSQRFDAGSRVFALGYASGSCARTGAVPSVIEPNHNPKVGRQKRRHVRPARQGYGGGGGDNLFGMFGAVAGAALVADALF